MSHHTGGTRPVDSLLLNPLSPVSLSDAYQILARISYVSAIPAKSKRGVLPQEAVPRLLCVLRALRTVQDKADFNYDSVDLERAKLYDRIDTSRTTFCFTLLFHFGL